MSVMARNQFSFDGSLNILMSDITDILGFLPASVYLCKINNADTRTLGGICSKLAMKTLE